MFTAAIIGRPNVGKSTLFNRVLGRRQAIVKDFPGVTRDRHYAECEYRGRRFQLVDTGGLVPSSDEQMFSLIREQSRRAIADANALIFLMDGREGLTPMDREIADLLRGVNKPVFVAINKIDTPKSDPLISEFYELGWEPLYPLSAEHGAGVAELLDALYSLLPAAAEGPTADIPKVAVVGRPNVGKSTFINTLLGEPRLVVSEEPGTTRDAIDTLVRYKKAEYLFIDTAG
ncbi:MAG: ribosome biogenesis GTPase Der, partial [Nitrospirae bacterium]